MFLIVIRILGCGECLHVHGYVFVYGTPGSYHCISSLLLIVLLRDLFYKLIALNCSIWTISAYIFSCVIFLETCAYLYCFMFLQPECSVLLDALEQSACNPEIAGVLAKSLLRILQLSAEKTFSSLKTLDAIPRVLKVACILARESRRPGNINPYVKSNTEVGTPHGPDRNWYKSVETSVELFVEYLLVTDDAKGSILHSSTCIDCLFELFWEKGLRNHVLIHIVGLMKVFHCIPSLFD